METPSPSTNETSMDSGFICSDRWIDSTFEQLRNWQPKKTIRRFDATAQSWMTAFLVHDSFNSLDTYLSNVARFRRLDDSGRLIQRFRAAHDAVRFRELKKALEALTGFSTVAHHGGMRINTVNAFSREFKPPHPCEAERAVRRLMLRRRELVAVGQLSLGGALASYIVFLTIHLLSDGNGRSARMLFASDCLVTAPGDFAHNIMALMMLHQMRGTSFHLAAACARAGDLSMLAECFEGAIIDSWPLLDRLEAFLAREDETTQPKVDSHPIGILYHMLDTRLCYSPRAE